jgi:hypothetical protein
MGMGSGCRLNTATRRDSKRLRRPALAALSITEAHPLAIRAIIDLHTKRSPDS